MNHFNWSVKARACDWAVEGKGGTGGLRVRAGREEKRTREEGERMEKEEERERGRGRKRMGGEKRRENLCIRRLGATWQAYNVIYSIIAGTFET